MPYQLAIPAELWRIDLRTMEFMDKNPPPRNAPDALVSIIRVNQVELVNQWNAKYPHNKV